MARIQRWSPQERRVLDTYVLAFARGKYRNRTEAARDYRLNIARLRRRYPRASWLEKSRTVSSIRRAMQKRGSVLRLPGRKPFWTAEERRILDGYARKAADCNGYTFEVAARDYRRHVEALRRSHPGWAWLKQRRTHAATVEKIRLRSHEFGRSYLNVAFSREEDAVFTRYAREVLAGKYRGVLQAALKARVEILRLHRENPHERWARAVRSYNAVWLRIARIAAGMGRSRPESPWSPEEDRVVERYARAVVNGRYQAQQAAGPCSQELVRRRTSGAGRKGQVPWAAANRTVAAVANRIEIKAHALGWDTGRKWWSPAEDVIIRRWARKYAASRWQYAVGTGRAVVEAASAELARQGFRRDERACRRRIRKVLRALAPASKETSGTVSDH